MLFLILFLLYLESSDRRDFFDNYNLQVIDYDLAVVTPDGQQAAEVIVQVGGGQYQMMKNALQGRYSSWQFPISPEAVKIYWNKGNDAASLKSAVTKAVVTANTKVAK